MERISGIYKITCVPTGKVYIGQSNNIYKRWTDHRLELRKNQHVNNYLQRAWNKYGEVQFEFEIIKKCNIDEMDKWEQYYIAVLNSNNFNYGFNLDSGGNFNKTHSKSTIEKIAAANQKKIYQFSPDFKLINSYKSLKEASEITGVSYAHISSVANGKRNSAGGFFWSYSDKIDCNIKKPRLNGSVHQFDLTGKYLKTYSSIKEASKLSGVSSGHISSVISGKEVQASGYQWKTGDLSNIKCDNVFTFKKIGQYDLNNQLLKIFDSTLEASKSVDGNANGIRRAINGGRKTYKNYKWKYILKEATVYR